MADPTSPQVESGRDGLMERVVSADAARKAASRFINAHFNNPDTVRPQISVPAQSDDDDLVLVAYIKQTGALLAECAEVMKRAERAGSQLAELAGMTDLAGCQPDPAMRKRIGNWDSVLPELDDLILRLGAFHG